MILHDKVAIITGGASGLGRAVVDALAAGGARVSLFDRDSERGVQAATELGSAAMFEQVDVTSESQVQAGIDATLARFGAIHICINCAGVPDAAKTVADGKPFPLALWDKVIAVNLTGTFNVLRLAAVAMARNEPEGDERGVIINLSSGAAQDGQMGQAAYAASKAGVIGLTLPVARDLAGLGIRCGMSDAGWAPPLADGCYQKLSCWRLPDKRQGLISSQTLWGSTDLPPGSARCSALSAATHTRLRPLFLAW